MPKLTREQQDELEQLIDATSVSEVVEALSNVCHEKAMHLLENWQDKGAAKSWTKDAAALEKLLAKIEN